MNPVPAAGLRARRLTLVVPDLMALWREGVAAAGHSAGLLGQMAGRGRAFRISSDCPHLELLAGGRPLPGAALISRLGDVPQDSAGDWLRCDPVALVPDLTRVWFARATLPALPGRLMAAVRAALVPMFSDHGLDFSLTDAGRGYLRLPAPPASRFVAPWHAQGAPLDQVMPDGPDAARWHHLLNASQMALHAVPGLDSLPPDLRPTSVWFWGAGERVPVFQPTPDTRLIGDDPLLAGSARWLGMEPDTRAPDMAGGDLVVHWSPDPALPAEDNLRRLNETWLIPTWSALGRGRVASLQIADYSRGFRLGRLDRLRFWRAPAQPSA